MTRGSAPAALACLVLLIVLLAGCARADQEHGVFRNRWWHFYERGLSRAEAGELDLAEADLRQCLALRRTDSRFARTWGMHFVQCFAHRELAHVLIRQGRRDEAEALLRTSMQHEPSAKAEWLLRSLTEAPTAAPADPGGQRTVRVEVAATPAGELSGRVVPPGVPLALVAPDGAATPVAQAGDGAFTVAIPPGAVLTAAGEAVTAPPAVEPTLVVDGPDGDAVVAAPAAWYRWRAAHPGGMHRLQVRDDRGDILADLELSGTAAAGTLRVPLAAGGRTLHWSLADGAGSAAAVVKRVVAAPPPTQDRALRAAALVLPLLAPRPGAMRQGDDARLVEALLDDGRFRLRDARADALLERELALVEAGLVDRSTAAAAGRRLASRYVIAGTMTRGAGDAECFLRLIHAESGRIVATADAYADGAAEAVLAAAVGRLRQAFPVVSAPAELRPDGMVGFAAGSRHGAVGLMIVHLMDGGGAQATAELVEVEADGSTALIVSGRPPASAIGVSE